MLFRRLPNGDIKVTDFQGNVANVRKQSFAIDGSKTGHGIDKVLFSGEQDNAVTLLACRCRGCTCCCC